MRTMRRALATAAIGVMAAGVIGMAAPAASAAPVSADLGTTSVSCDYYKNMAAKWAKVAKNSGGKKADVAKRMSKSYLAKYYACIA